MKTQVIIIHGGETFDSYKQYLGFLKNVKLDFERFRSGRKGWKDGIGAKLGKNFDVILPAMPGKLNAQYTEWRLWFDKFVPHFKSGAILIGHSLGGIFLAKYLCERHLPKKVRATILISAPFDESDSEHSLGEFRLPKKLNGLTKQGGRIYIYHSTDDPVVPFSHAQKYLRALPSATLRTFTRKGHFNQETFPEIVRELKGL